ncbi:MAG: LysR family transcriptional regulator [Gammaproteobacteria bacterium]|nr:LysR family transcriptional regulator [Gammaproteobacteria bacterium]
MNDVTIHELACFVAVATEGSFQAAADKLHRTHPTVHAAVKSLEQRLNLQLLDRSGYRVTLTEEGTAFHPRARLLLQHFDNLRTYAGQLAKGEESELRVVIGDLCPLPQTLGLLKRFFSDCSNTRLHLHFEALAGPAERLLDGDADLILHQIDKSDQRLESIDFTRVRLVPVVAPGFLPFPISRSMSPEQMQNRVQCVIRDSARHSITHDYFLIEGAHRWTVSDQFMKKEIILQGMGWGHMPLFLIEQELRDGRLLSIAGQHFAESELQLVAARRHGVSHGPIANRLWQYLREQTANL